MHNVCYTTNIEADRRNTDTVRNDFRAHAIMCINPFKANFSSPLLNRANTVSIAALVMSPDPNLATLDQFIILPILDQLNLQQKNGDIAIGYSTSGKACSNSGRYAFVWFGARALFPQCMDSIWSYSRH